MVSALIGRIWAAAAQAEMLAVEYDSRSVLEALQLTKLNALLQRFAQHPVWRLRLSEHGINPDRTLRDLGELSAYPVMTKTVITRQFDEWFPQGGYSLDSTSGSTGRNFKFYHDRAARTAQSAAIRLCCAWIGIDYNTDRKAIVWGRSPLPWQAALADRVKLILLNAFQLQAYGLTDDMAERYLSILRRRQPEALIGYPGYVAHLARVGLKASRPPPSSLQAVILSGEQTLPQQAEVIRRYFGDMVFQRYGSREFGAIAHECPSHSGLHVPPTRFVLEHNAAGELLVTDLDNSATPFVRYAIGDCGSVSWVSCRCGREHQTISGLQGRSNDYVVAPSGVVLPAQFWTTLSRKGNNNVCEFQVVQESPTRVAMLVVPVDDRQPIEETLFRETVSALSNGEIDLHVKRVLSIPLTPAGKRRFILRHSFVGQT
jgi:phenylacetate-CoA ligase